ncbi:phosphotransferase family protein [Actinopolymorpha alba]|uniref:phosphotransferase family protein n=1 Tax=Actinopolymorpha alba TaxID=533267 RepID=UPI0003A64B75|nr:aminoglycoside phosphotransferase family protein [Actinopolymorpha alba]
MRLTETSVVDHLRRRGVAGSADDVRARVLAGGVSGTTFLVTVGEERYVVKQPLPYLKVADEWPARLERATVEAEALAVLNHLTPDFLPRLVDYDPEAFVLTMVAAPDAWNEWRAVLLRATVDVAAGEALGRVLATWHAKTAGDAELLSGWGDLEMFVELRGDPYHRTLAARRPDLAEPVLACLDELLTRQVCLVHGDFSPKNVLVSGAGAAGGLWVLDFEVAHLGNPVFDVAFLLHHLVMKAVHVVGAGPRLQACGAAFLSAYATAGGLVTDPGLVVRHTGALLLARVHGKSPAAYLTRTQAERVSVLGAAAVRGDYAGPGDLWAAATA